MKINSMDVHHLAILNSQLESLIQQRRFELEKLELSFMNQLFERGCGFTEFLVKVFCQVSWRDVENCRLVSKRWKEFIDRLAFLFLKKNANMYHGN